MGMLFMNVDFLVFIPDGGSCVLLGERISPQESPFKAIYISIRHPYSLCTKEKICLNIRGHEPRNPIS